MIGYTVTRSHFLILPHVRSYHSTQHLTAIANSYKTVCVDPRLPEILLRLTVYICSQNHDTYLARHNNSATSCRSEEVKLESAQAHASNPESLCNRQSGCQMYLKRPLHWGISQPSQNRPNLTTALPHPYLLFAHPLSLSLSQSQPPAILVQQSEGEKQGPDSERSTFFYTENYTFYIWNNP